MFRTEMNLVESMQLYVQMINETNNFLDTTETLSDYSHPMRPVDQFSTSPTSSVYSLSPSNSLNSSAIIQPSRATQMCSNSKKLRSENVSINFEQFPKKQSFSNEKFCQFCRNNGESANVYKSHMFRDYRGKVLCPILKLHQCPICGESGEKAHTITYCKMYKASRLNSFIKN